MVIMSIEKYEALIKILNIYLDLEISEQNIVEGNVLDAKDALTEMKNKYTI